MAKFSSIFNKSHGSGVSENLDRVKQNLKKSTGRLAYKDDERHSKFIIEEIETLIGRFPGSPDFLGRAEYTVKKKLSLINRSYPSISSIRDDISKFAAQNELANPRKKIKKLLKKYPAYANLRALNAIQIFNDTSQSGLDEKKIKVVQSALREISRALINGALNIYNINWFIKIYIRYLDSLRKKFIHEYNGSKNHYAREVRLLSEDLHRKQLQLSVMLGVKNKLSGLTMLNAKLKGSVYITGNISKDDITKACIAIKSDDGTRKIGEGGKTAKNILYIVMTINLLFSRIPILDNMVKNFQRSIPDVSRDIVLQKVMVNNMRSITRFQLAMSGGDKDETSEVAKKMFLDCIDIIKQHLDNGVMTKQHEVDPFLKAAWIAKESQGLFPDEEYKKKLEQALALIDIVLGKRTQVKGAYEMARQLQDDINFIMIENEWIK